MPTVTWSGIIGRITGCAVAAFGLYGVLCSSLLTPYINQGSDSGRVVGVYNGYQRIAKDLKSNDELVLFWGSSMVREGVDCDLLQAQEKGVRAYNLSVSGDIPYRRSVELPRVLALHPKRVVIGVSYETFETRTPFEDQIGALPLAAYTEMPEEARGLMNDRFREIAGRSDLERTWWKRKFLVSAVCWKLGIPDRSNPIPAGFVDNLKAPHVYTKNIQATELARFLKQRKGIYPPYTQGGDTNPARSSSAQSLALLVKSLSAQNTEIVLAIMPLHPLLNAEIPAERHAKLQGFLSSFASQHVEVCNFENAFGPECFVDLLHLNERGRIAFTAAIAPHVAAAKPVDTKLALTH